MGVIVYNALHSVATFSKMVVASLIIFKIHWLDNKWIILAFALATFALIMQVLALCFVVFVKIRDSIPPIVILSLLGVAGACTLGDLAIIAWFAFKDHPYNELLLAALVYDLISEVTNAIAVLVHFLRPQAPSLMQSKRSSDRSKMGAPPGAAPPGQPPPPAQYDGVYTPPYAYNQQPPPPEQQPPSSEKSSSKKKKSKSKSRSKS